MCNAGGGAIPLYALLVLTGRTQGLYKRELSERHSRPSVASCCSSHGNGLELSARQRRIRFALSQTLINCL